eukprot:1265174-Rhodomonas_salina.2
MRFSPPSFNEANIHHAAWLPQCHTVTEIATSNVKLPVNGSCCHNLNRCHPGHQFKVPCTPGTKPDIMITVSIPGQPRAQA